MYKAVSENNNWDTFFKVFNQHYEAKWPKIGKIKYNTKKAKDRVKISWSNEVKVCYAWLLWLLYQTLVRNF